MAGPAWTERLARPPGQRRARSDSAVASACLPSRAGNRSLQLSRPHTHPPSQSPKPINTRTQHVRTRGHTHTHTPGGPRGPEGVRGYDGELCTPALHARTLYRARARSLRRGNGRGDRENAGSSRVRGVGWVSSQGGGRTRMSVEGCAGCGPVPLPPISKRRSCSNPPVPRR